jgi:histidinol dehydrogenase
LIKIIKVTNLSSFAASITPKLPQKNKKTAQSIIENIKKNGDKALFQYEKKFGGANLSSFQVTSSEIKSAYSLVSQSEITSIRQAKSRLSKTESVLKSLLKNKKIKSDGVSISKKFIPIPSVGCYVPGGLAKYPSSAVMSIIPAKIAGVKRIVVVSPPDKTGHIHPLTIVAADICGADEIYKTGGAQSIAALTFGTKSIKPVDKIVGPGGAFVTAAKSLIGDTTGIDMLAGPTELGIIADNFANPQYVALDLISQAEHSVDTLCYCITTSEKLAKSISVNISKILPKIKREKIVKSSLKNNGFIAIVKSKSDMFKLTNLLSPEHLQIMTNNPESDSTKITTSGLVLLGNYTPSSASDYLLGSNHILPTNRFGKIRGPLSVFDFIKINTIVSSSKSGLSKISSSLDVLTTSEELYNHYESVKGRLP